VALRTDGSMVAWGRDDYNQVSNTPSGTGFTQVDGGAYHCVALRTDGSMESWGVDDQGQFDHGQVPNTPAETGFIQVAAGALFTLACDANNSGNATCSGDGSGASCPCLGFADTGQGCMNSGGLGGAALTASGNASFAADTFQLHVGGIPGTKAGLCVKGSALLAGGNGNPVGDGLLCASPQMRSHVIISNASGNLAMSNWRGQPFGTFPGVANAGAPTYYQWWYRDPANSCSGSGFNFTNAWAVTWQP